MWEWLERVESEWYCCYCKVEDTCLKGEGEGCQASERGCGAARSEVWVSRWPSTVPQGEVNGRGWRGPHGPGGDLQAATCSCHNIDSSLQEVLRVAAVEVSKTWW
jgi:hypothetical protein